MRSATVPAMLGMQDYWILERDGQVESRMTRPEKPGRVAGTPLLIVLAMAQFMVVLDGMLLS
jgi:hypothetical protein